VNGKIAKESECSVASHQLIATATRMNASAEASSALAKLCLLTADVVTGVPSVEQGNQ